MKVPQKRSVITEKEIQTDPMSPSPMMSMMRYDGLTGSTGPGFGSSMAIGTGSGDDFHKRIVQLELQCAELKELNYEKDSIIQRHVQSIKGYEGKQLQNDNQLSEILKRQDQ